MSKKIPLLIFLITLTFSGCTRFTPYQSPSSNNQSDYHLVRKGDTLYSIAWDAGHDYRKVAAWNNIRWPYRIHPGQRISLKPNYVATAPKKESKPKKTRKNTPAKTRKKTTTTTNNAAETEAVAET